MNVKISGKGERDLESRGNVQCLDVLSAYIGAMNKEPKVVDAFLTELASAQGLDKRFDVFLNGLKDEFVDLSTLEYRSRSVVEKLAGLNYGTFPVGVNCKAIIERAKPQV